MDRTAQPVGKPRAKLRRADPMSASTSDLDFAARLRVFQRTLRGRLDRDGVLLDVVRAVNSTGDPARLCELILEQAAKWVPAPCWAVVSADSSGNLSMLAERGVMPDMTSAVHAAASFTMRHGEFTAADLRSDRRASDPSVGAVLAFPLTNRGRRIGALIALDREPSGRPPKLEPRVLRAVRILLEPAAAALDNVMQLKRVEALSLTDDLTLLYNRRYLDQTLRRETKRALRGGRPLSLLFLDLDGFKSINDSHGHLYGSRALVEAATVVKQSARETDIVTRFGGDEFALVLPETGTEGAVAVGERVRQRIAAHAFLAADGFNIHLTASVGVATLPDVAVSPDELMQAADMAMYRVKQSGKNGIQAAAAQTDT